MSTITKAGISTAELVDIRDVHIDKALSQSERVQSFVEQVKNPYCFKVGDVVVRVTYANDGPTLNQRMAEVISLV